MDDSRKWAVWLTGTVGTFAVLETKALRGRMADKPSGTLTATMRRWLGINPRARRRFLLAPAFAAFTAYLYLHFCHGFFNA